MLANLVPWDRRVRLVSELRRLGVGCVTLAPCWGWGVSASDLGRLVKSADWSPVDVRRLEILERLSVESFTLLLASCQGGFLDRMFGGV